MDVMLVQPRGLNWLPGLEDVIVAANLMPPLGLCSLAAYLEQQGFSCGITDFFLEKLDHESRCAAILRHNPAWIGLSCTTSSFLDGYAFALAVKRESPGTKIVIGGVHVSAIGPKLLEDYQALDYGILGEGEQALAELLRGEPPAKIPGLVYREGESVVVTPRREEGLDLDTLPFPAYHRLPGFPKRYYLPLFNYPSTPNGTMITSRGCPYQCSYCDRSVFRRTYRVNSADYVYEHLRYLKTTYGMRHITFYDDLFTYDRARVVKLCDLLDRKPLGLTFNCIVQLAHVDGELARRLKHAGCWMVNVGIETGDRDLLRLHKPNLQYDEILPRVKVLQRAGLRVKGLFIMGLPGETEASIGRTAQFIQKLGLDDMNMAKFAPFPGAPIYRRLPEMGTLTEDWSKMNAMNFIFRPEGIESLERLEELYKQFMQSYYQNPRIGLAYLKMLWLSPHSWYVVLKSLPLFIRARKAFQPERK